MLLLRLRAALRPLHHLFLQDAKEAVVAPLETDVVVMVLLPPPPVVADVPAAWCPFVVGQGTIASRSPAAAVPVAVVAGRLAAVASAKLSVTAQAVVAAVVLAPLSFAAAVAQRQVALLPASVATLRSGPEAVVQEVVVAVRMRPATRQEP